MKIIKRIALVTLILAISAIIFGCGTVKKTLTVHNASDMHLTALRISDKEDFSDEERIVYVYDSNTAMSPEYSEDFIIEIPEALLENDLYVLATLTSIEPFEHYEIVQSIGKALSEDAWGVSIDFDSENESIVVTVLDDSAI